MDQKREKKFDLRSPGISPDRGIILFDREYKICKIDELAGLLLGKSLKECLKRGIYEVLSPYFNEIVSFAKKVIEGALNEKIIITNYKGKEINFYITSIKGSPDSPPLLGVLLIDNYQGKKDEIYRMAGLKKIGSIITASVFDEGFYQLLLREATDILNAEAGTIAVIEQGEELYEDVVFRYTLGEKADILKGVSLKPDMGIIGWVIKNGEPAITNDARKDPRFFPWVDYLTGFITRSIICVPIKINGEPIGALEIINKREGIFDSSDLNLLRLFSKIISERIENYSSRAKWRRDYEFLSGVIDTIREGIVIVDRDLRIKFSNQSFSLLFNNEKEGIIGRSLKDIVRGLDLKTLIDSWYNEVFQGEGRTLLESTIKDYKGESRFYRITAEPFEIDDEVVSTALINFCDITNLKRLESFLDAGVRLSSAFTGVEDLEDASQRALKIIGETIDGERAGWFEFKINSDQRKVLNFRSLWRINDQENYSFDLNSFSKFLSYVEPELKEGKIVFKTRVDCSSNIKESLEAMGIDSVILVPIQIRGRLHGAIRIDNPKTLYPLSPEEINFFKTVSDSFSKAIAREDYLKKIDESEIRYREIYDNLSNIWYIHDMEGRIIECNKAASKITGYSEDELLNMSVKDLIAPQYRNEFNNYLEEIRSNKRAEGLMRILTKEGTEKILDYKNWVVRLPDGNTGVRGFVKDVTEKIRIRHQFRHAQKMESIGILASGISHNFKNLLSGIMGHCQLIREKFRSYPELQRHANEIVKLCSIGNRLISGLLGYSHKDRRYKVELINVSEVLDEAWNLLSHSIGKSIRVEKEWPKELWLKGNSGALLQVIINLCTNARDAMPEGGLLRVLAKRQESTAVIIVEDTGCGMSKDIKNKIFDPFFTTKEKGKGTGLGLYTTYEIVKEHGGRIDVESTPGKGTKFEIHLPLSGINIKLDGEVKERYIRGDGKKVLIVDDDINTLLPMKDLLALRGYRVEYSYSPKEALNKLLYWEPDIVLVDKEMPEMDGISFINEAVLRKVDAHIILITGYDDLEDLESDIKDIIKGHIPKPLDIDRLCSVLESLC